MGMIKLKDILIEDLYEYFYHATTPDALPGIVKHGLLPSKDPH
jgi:RNA:NAD 2'-phosphotransferase (TPT1/KptA family)